MKSFREILRAYLAVDDLLQTEETRARTATRKATWANDRRINDQAYFVILFAQLEEKIKASSTSLVAKRIQKANWSSRRAWDTFDVERMSFKGRVSLLVDKHQTEYAKIMKYYKIRCDLAHGVLYAKMPIVIVTVAADFQALAAKLKGR